MKLARLPYTPEVAIEFHDEALTALGAVCARPWHDRLELLAEGRAATPWNPDGALHEGTLHFVPAGASGARDAAGEIFPGCPLTFRLTEVLRPSPVPLERVVLATEGARAARAPDPAVVEKIWRAQFPDTTRWRLTTPFIAGHHFSLLALARCEIQAIDQHWALHRVAVALPGGESDEGLACDFGFAQAEVRPTADLTWPAPDPAAWGGFVVRALERDMTAELAGIRERQQHHLARELDRIDDYFATYADELAARAKRGSAGAGAKIAERLAAARAEHARHRADQVARHEIVIHPHLDALLLVAEPAWHATVHVAHAHHAPQEYVAHFVPRARRWELAGAGAALR